MDGESGLLFKVCGSGFWVLGFKGYRTSRFGVSGFMGELRSRILGF